MAGSDIIVLSDILQRDLYSHQSIEGVVAELKDLAVNLNRTRLFFAWKVGQFADNRKLSTQFGIKSCAELARLMDTTEQTISRYRTVYKLLTESQVRQLGSMGVSINVVLELANIHNKGYKEECQQLLEAVVSNDITTAKEINDEFASMLIKLAQPSNLLPGGEVPLSDADSNTLLGDIEEVESASVSPADKIIDADIVSDGGESGDEEAGEDDGTADLDTDSNTSLSSRDAQAALRIFKQSVASRSRDCVAITRDHEVMLDRDFEMQSVILSDAAASAEFDEAEESLADSYMEVVKTAVNILCDLANAGYLQRQVKLPSKAYEVFNGLGLFTQDE